MGENTTWAEREIDIYREREANIDEDFSYTLACCNSALKAYKSLCEDEHTCFSIGVTKEILNRLIDGKVLTPITKSDEWIKCDFTHDPNVDCYRSSRMHSLYKHVNKETGETTYRDANDAIGVETTGSGFNGYHSGLVSHIWNELRPITFPYMPPYKPARVFTEEYLTDSKNGDFDTVGVLYVITPEDERIEINRYFAEPESEEDKKTHKYYCGYIEITKDEYEHRKRMDAERAANMLKNKDTEESEEISSDN